KASRRGEPEASANLGRPIIFFAAPAGGTNRCECARKLAERSYFHNSFIALSRRTEPLADERHQLVAHLPVSVEPLRAVALDRSRVDRRPVLDSRRIGAAQFHRL